MGTWPKNVYNRGCDSFGRQSRCVNACECRAYPLGSVEVIEMTKPPAQCILLFCILGDATSMLDGVYIQGDAGHIDSWIECGSDLCPVGLVGNGLGNDDQLRAVIR